MVLLLVTLVLNVVCIVHAAKTGRFWPWAYVVLLLPGVGAFAYILFELLPDWQRSVGGQRARQTFNRTFNPEKRYRDLSERLEDADTLANRVALAEECLDTGKFDEARFHYGKVLANPMGEEPRYLIAKARAEFGVGQAQVALSDLEELKRRWPDYESAEGHLLYARLLEATGRVDEALTEYRSVSNYYPGAEARVRYALLLGQQGRPDEANAILAEVVRQLKRAPRYVRKNEAEWMKIAEHQLRN